MEPELAEFHDMIGFMQGEAERLPLNMRIFVNTLRNAGIAANQGMKLNGFGGN